MSEAKQKRGAIEAPGAKRRKAKGFAETRPATEGRVQ
jgi:hypothetical protein